MSIKIKAIIVDDEESARLILKAKIEALCPAIEIVGLAESANEARTLIKRTAPDLLFLDVAMPNESGFDLLHTLDQLNFEIIFVTGFDAYAIDAIQFCAIGYLLKPLQNENLVKSVYNASERINQKKENIRNNQLLENITNPGSVQNKIGIPTMEGLEFVKAEAIFYCEGLQKCTKIYIDGQKSLISSYNIGEFIRLLEPYGFFATHKSYLINLSKIKRYNKEGTVHLEDGSAVPVSKRRKAEFLNLLPRL